MSVKYFPFTPGIGWNLKNNKYIIPRVSPIAFDQAMKNRDAIIVTYGGLLESFLSLSYFEMINQFYPSTKMYWCGNDQFNPLIKLNGVGVVSPEPFPHSLLKNYPVPIFLDKKDNIYFNCLNNYLEMNNYLGLKEYKNKRSLYRQVLSNLLFNWNSSFLPKLRNRHLVMPVVKSWAKVNNLDLNRPFILICPEIFYSQHKVSCLNWKEKEIKALGAMLKQRGVSTIVCTNSPGRYYGGAVYTIPVKFEQLVYLMTEARAVLSETIDCLLIANMISKLIIFSLKIRKPYSFKLNSSFFKFKNNFFEKDILTPEYVFERLHAIY